MGLASGYVAFKALYDNQVVINRHRPHPYREEEGIQAGVFDVDLLWQ